MNNSQALVRHQKATRRKPAQPRGLEGQEPSLGCRVALVPVLLLGGTYKLLLGLLVLKMLRHPLFLFLAGVIYRGH